jgi:hypothetical protein
MDRNKSGLKGAGLVMHPFRAEGESSLNTGYRVKFIGDDSHDTLTLKGTLSELYTAQNRLVLLINKVIVDGIITNEEIECLTNISDALLHGINYAEHVRNVLGDLK